MYRPLKHVIKNVQKGILNINKEIAQMEKEKISAQEKTLYLEDLLRRKRQAIEELTRLQKELENEKP